MIRKGGFTLVEILVVVLILGILAAVVVPQFTGVSTATRTSSMATDLRRVRSQIELYKYQHNEQLPAALGEASADFVRRMTTPTDADGNYTLYCPPGDYSLLPFAPGRLADLSQNMVTVVSNQFTTKDLAVTDGTFTLSGRLRDQARGDGIPGLVVLAQSSDGFFSIGFSDMQGDYSLGVVPGEWEVWVNPTQLPEDGYQSVARRCLECPHTLAIAGAQAVDTAVG